MEFLAWHYSFGIAFYIKGIRRTINYVHHYFSLPLLLLTMFSPWKRLIVAETGPGFDVKRMFETWTFNMVSRGIGALVRFFLIWIAIIILIAVLLGGIAGLFFWFLFPFLSLPQYEKYKKQPAIFTKDILTRIKTSNKNPLIAIFDNEAGRFVLTHLNLSLTNLIENASLEGISFDDAPDSSYPELLSYLFTKNIWDRDYLFSLNITPEDVGVVASWWEKKVLDSQVASPDLGRPGIATELTYGYTPTLNKYSVDLSAPQSFTHHLIGRGAIVERIERTLLSGQNVFLTGDPGVGKKTVVLEFAWKAITGQLGREISYKRVFEFDYNGILATTQDLNQKKMELTQVLTEAAYAGNIILMIRDLHRLLNPQVEGYDFTDVFEPLLEKRNLKIISVTSSQEYERYLASNFRIRKFFEHVPVIPPDRETAMQILIEAANRWELLTQKTILYQSLKTMIQKSEEYVTEAPFPEKVIELLDAAITYASQSQKPIIDVDDVNAVLAEKTGISFARLTENEKQKLGNLEDLIHERLVNQETAISLLAKTIRAKTVGAVSEGRPLGSFLFLGPTGVGKTETAKVLAQVYYGSSSEILRFDMAEYSGSEGLERLIGSASRNMPGALTTAIKNKPASLLLLDEIEKATPEIFNLFLAMLDEGVITDAFGKQVNCRNLFIIGTSNAGAEYIRSLVNASEPEESLQTKVINYILEQNIFSPEFVNRFDGAVVFEPLSKENLVKVAKLMLGDFAKNLESKNIYMVFDEGVYEKLAEDGFEPAFGARPMRRIVNIVIGDIISRGILSGEIREGFTIKLLPDSGKEAFRWERV